MKTRSFSLHVLFGLIQYSNNALSYSMNDGNCNRIAKLFIGLCIADGDDVIVGEALQSSGLAGC